MKTNKKLKDDPIEEYNTYALITQNPELYLTDIIGTEKEAATKAVNILKYKHRILLDNEIFIHVNKKDGNIYIAVGTGKKKDVRLILVKQ